MKCDADILSPAETRVMQAVINTKGGRVLIFGDEVVTHTKKDLRRIKRCKKWGINPDTI